MTKRWEKNGKKRRHFEKKREKNVFGGENKEDGGENRTHWTITGAQRIPKTPSNK
jgi:hypothetical protein